ncbi:hypothetical protein L484_000493 [Morus notabilis]|uniref:Uncharacterized protein n=1 Tax=Morus notabilis TaxID=981085 RepID=W9SM05_9ROSA|nr:hypothetical protein L484_000493 [Morus notabilis]
MRSKRKAIGTQPSKRSEAIANSRRIPRPWKNRSFLSGETERNRLRKRDRTSTTHSCHSHCFKLQNLKKKNPRGSKPLMQPPTLVIS